jgi:endonuclease/exonuclease/phosphatase family metal-dependent hydrolase
MNLESQAYIDADPRQIQIYNMILVDDNTIKFTLFVTHLKAGSTDDDKTKRADATQKLMNYIDNKGAGNYFFMGDFNFYSSDAEAYQNITNPSNSSIAFLDPIDREGNWHNNSSFADIHTQATHENDDDCFSYGGMDDRFDFIFISKNIKNKTAGIKYVANSYSTIGQDGNHFNKSINEGVNSSVSSEMADALFNMSDHLPLSLEIECDATITANISSINNHSQIICVPNPFNEKLNIQYEVKSPSHIKIFNITGQLVYSNYFNSAKNINIEWNTTKLKKGLYFIQIQNANSTKTVKAIKI